MMGAALFPDLVVNGEVVPHRLVAAEAQNHAAPKGKPGVAWRKATNAVAVRTLLLQEARRRGLRPEPDEVAPGRFETDDEALIRSLLETGIEVTPPTERELRAEWRRNPGRFRAPPLWEASHILVACDPDETGSREPARRRAVDIARAARADPEGFAGLAARESDCGSKTAGGQLGQFRPGDTVPEFEAVLRHLQDGEVTPEPILTRHGWHVIRLDALAEGEVLPYETVRTKIAEAMEKAAWARAARDLVARLVRGAEISGADLERVQ